MNDGDCPVRKHRFGNPGNQSINQTCKTACLWERMQPPSRRPEVAISASLPTMVQNDSSRSNEPYQDHVIVWAHQRALRPSQSTLHKAQAVSGERRRSQQAKSWLMQNIFWTKPNDVVLGRNNFRIVAEGAMLQIVPPHGLKARRANEGPS